MAEHEAPFRLEQRGMPDGTVHIYFVPRNGEPQLMGTINTAIADDYPDLLKRWREIFIVAIDRKVQQHGGPGMVRYEEVKPPLED